MAFFSVIIPTFNNAMYLEKAIESVLDQTDPDLEIIVVDDGSIDETSVVAAKFSSLIRYFRQENLGPAAARNTGIRIAEGAYIALLDADDEWLPEFLEEIRILIALNPDTDVFYCAAQCIEASGIRLPQIIGVHAFQPGRLYDALLRENFLIPSTMVLRRSTVVDVGSFDSDVRSLTGCEDWDLWLRLARTHRFIGTSACLVRYRVHSGNMSADVASMQHAALTMVEKHFGPDDGHPETWPAEKRRAYGGLHRYNSITSMLRAGDWKTCAEQLRRALLVDSTLVEDGELFYELASGTQPLGWRGTAEGLDPVANMAETELLLQRVFNPPRPKDLARICSLAYATAYAALARVAWLTGDRQCSRICLLKAARHRARVTLDVKWWRGLIRTFVPGFLSMNRRSQFRSAKSA